MARRQAEEMVKRQGAVEDVEVHSDIVDLKPPPPALSPLMGFPHMHVYGFPLGGAEV